VPSASCTENIVVVVTTTTTTTTIHSFIHSFTHFSSRLERLESFLWARWLGTLSVSNTIFWFKFVTAFWPTFRNFVGLCAFSVAYHWRNVLARNPAGSPVWITVIIWPPVQWVPGLFPQR
jgi:hypothetical protein